MSNGAQLGSDAHSMTFVPPPSVHLPFDQLEFADLSLSLAVWPRLDDCGVYGALVVCNAVGQGCNEACAGDPWIEFGGDLPVAPASWGGRRKSARSLTDNDKRRPIGGMNLMCLAIVDQCEHGAAPRHGRCVHPDSSRALSGCIFPLNAMRMDAKRHLFLVCHEQGLWFSASTRMMRAAFRGWP